MKKHTHSHTPDLHESARDLFALINSPELLETQTLAEIHKDFERADYSLEDPTDVTIGWTRKLEGGGSKGKTGAMIRTKDHKLAHVGIGSGGAYWVTVLAENADAMSAPEAHAAAQYIRNYCEGFSSLCAQGPAFMQSAEQLLAQYPDPVQHRAQGFVSRIRSIFGKKPE